LPDGRGRAAAALTPHNSVLLLHGLGGTSDWWRRNVDALAAEHRVLAPDLDFTHATFGKIAEKLARSSSRSTSSAIPWAVM
jgi:pimeloyl-ACP methyl ester carboxylesterase